MQPVELRPYQQTAKNAIYAGWHEGKRNMLLVLPTGGGKSVIASDIALDWDRQNISQAVIAHRVELVSQLSMHVARRGIYHRIIAPSGVISEAINEQREELGRSYVNHKARCGVAGIDTLLARSEQIRPWAQQVGAWMIDEGHHVLAANKWGKGAALFPNAWGLGMTASPSRADGMGLGRHADGLYDGMHVATTMRELIDSGSLCEYDLVLPKSDFEIDDSDLPPSGDFSVPKMRNAVKNSHLIGDVVKEYIKHAMGKRGITFATDVESANDIAARYNEAGIPAAAVSAKTPSKVRREYIRRFKAGKLLQLVNVDLFGEGFDVPAVEVVSMARPTMSLAVYLQQVGRALRTMPGKLAGLIIDHVGNYKRHRLPDHPRFWTLDRRDKRAKSTPDPMMIELMACDNCSRPFEKALLRCPRCGEFREIPEPGRRTIEAVDGDLHLVDRETLQRMREAAILESAADLASRTSFAAGSFAASGAWNRQVERIGEQERLKNALAWWIGKQRSGGMPDAESERRFYLSMGIDVLTALTLPRADMTKIADTVEGWLK